MTMKTPDAIIFEFGNVPRSDTVVISYRAVCELMWEAQKEALAAAAEETCDGCNGGVPVVQLATGRDAPRWVHLDELADPAIEYACDIRNLIGQRP